MNTEYLKDQREEQQDNKGEPFNYKNRGASKRHEKVNRYYEIMITLVEFIAALLFLVGSIFFFYETLKEAAIWMFVVGSAFFIVRPGMRLAREMHLASLPQIPDIKKPKRVVNKLIKQVKP